MAAVNLEALRDIGNGEKQQIRELCQLYIRDTAEHLEHIKTDLERGNFLRIKRIAHGLAGASSMLGMVAILPPLRRLENLDPEADQRIVAPILEDAVRAFAQIRSFLEANQLLEP